MQAVEALLIARMEDGVDDVSTVAKVQCHLLRLHLASLWKLHESLTQDTASVSLADGALVTMACRQVAKVAMDILEDESWSAPQPLCKAVLAVIDNVTIALPSAFSSGALGVPPLLNFRRTQPADAAPPPLSFPLFGWLERDFSAMESFAGAEHQLKIARPVRLSLLPDTVGNYGDAVVALDQALRLCTNLSHQTEIQNSYALRAALVEHVLTTTLPAPLPPTADAVSCFWRCKDTPMRRADQVELLRLLLLLSRHYATAVLSTHPTVLADAARILVLATVAAIADAVTRRAACDVPSPFSLHYSGDAGGPGTPFGFELGDFRLESAEMRFHEARLVARRTREALSPS